MEELNRKSVGRWAGQRALSTPTAAIVMIVVILVVGGLGYVGLNAQSQSPVTKSSCFPATATACGQSSGTHDVGLQVPFKAVQQGSVVPYTATLPSGESATSYTFDYGDGNSSTSASSSAQWKYQYPGTYIASVTATVGGVVHDNYFKLVGLSVAASYGSASAGNIPGVVGSIVSNSSPVAGLPPSAVLQVGDSLTVQGTYSSAPTNPLYSLQAPTWAYTSTLAPPTNPTTSPTSASATFGFPTAGSYWVTFVGSAVNAGGTVALQDFTWSVFVAATGIHAATVGGASAASPHKNSLVVYELVPGGSNTEDPAIDYETAGYEPIVNVYQQLIAYNGSQVGPTYSTAVPVLATCVPGSPQCESLYGAGTTLINGWNYTFVVDPNAKFYDPANGASWGVYPTDVYFSAARTMAFSTDPCAGCNNGWILTQSLLPD
ncbi:MAG TPA: hypothetical protein VIZ68_05195, partial [Thermoplasmata archaeon]